MKRIFIPLCLILLIILTPTQAAYAATGSYLARPVGRECYFFSDKDLSTALFAVPYTYCIQVIRDDGEWLYASYAVDEGDYKKIYGYCKSDEFEQVPSTPKSQYLNKTVVITYSAGENQGSFNPPADLQVEAAYYGGYRHGANFYSYVLCRGSFCYIEGDCGDYPLNEYEEQTSKPETEDGQRDTNGATTTGLIIFIVILAVALVAVGGLAFTSKKKPPSH
ncbi:MAG: hypothetical protein ACI4MN_02635 [Candidatus Coproplasma sp.]